MCFYAFPDHQNQVLKKFFFNVWSGKNRVLMHLRILPDHQNHVFKKEIFLTPQVIKNVFLCISRPPESSP